MGKKKRGNQCLPTGSWTTVYLLLLLLTVTETVKGDALVSSWLLNCTRHHNSKTQENIDCLKKMLVHLSVVHGKSGESDTMETFVTHVRDHGGVSRDLEEPYRITVYKSDVYAQYPLEYIQSFDGFPDEVELLAPDCKDDSNEKNPNCGWLYNKAGERLKDSQGFCCLCTLKDELPRWLGGNSSSRRSKQDCNSTWSSFLNLLPWRRRGSAHCLRHSTQWYPTYQIGSFRQSFTIRVVADLVYSNGETSSLDRTNFDFVEVTSHQRVHINSRRTMKGKLRQHTVLTAKPPLLTDRYLSIPYEQSQENPEHLVKGRIDFSTNTNKWLALPKNFYTLDGSGCDKIGVSSNAFRSQVQPCSKVFQSCFGNQLDNFAKDETGRLERGENPLYALPRYDKMFASHQMRNSTLNLLTNQTVTSILSLELKADNLKYFLDRSPGKIVDASIKLPTSNQSDGLLKVEILNTGKITANFTLHTEECPLQLNTSTVQVSSSKPRNILSSFTFNLSETDEISYHSTCRVFLEDNMGDRTDVFDVKFDHPSQEELAYLLRAETTEGISSWVQWIWDLFNLTKLFGGFGTSFNWCWFSCPNLTIETESSQPTFQCEYGGAVQQNIGEGGLIRCPGPPQNATGFASIFNWKPCGQCINILLDFKCYVTTLCWREILLLLLYLMGGFLVLYFLWMMYQAGLLGPTVERMLALLGVACKAICSGLTQLFGGRERSGGSSEEGSDSDDSDDSDSNSDSDDDGGGGGRSRSRRSYSHSSHSKDGGGRFRHRREEGRRRKEGRSGTR